MPRGIPNPNPSGPLSRKALSVLANLRAGNVDGSFTIQIQDALLRRGLIEWSRDDNAYHVTPAGEALLDGQPPAAPHIVTVHPLPTIIPDGDGDDQSITPPLHAMGRGSEGGDNCPPECPYRMAVDLLARLGLVSARGLVADLERLRQQLKRYQEG